MCMRPDCPTKSNPRAKYLKTIEETRDNQYYTPGLDDMPDKFHVKPRRLWVMTKKKSDTVTFNEEQMEGKRKEMDEAWAALPDPKPDFMDWAANRTRQDQYWQAYNIAHNDRSSANRLKALSLLLDFTKQKPKSPFEVPGLNMEGMTNRELLAKVLELNGLKSEDVDKLLPEKVH